MGFVSCSEWRTSSWKNKRWSPWEFWFQMRYIVGGEFFTHLRKALGKGVCETSMHGYWCVQQSCIEKHVATTRIFGCSLDQRTDVQRIFWDSVALQFWSSWWLPMVRGRPLWKRAVSLLCSADHLHFRVLLLGSSDGFAVWFLGVVSCCVCQDG